jgi:hypothetical protein
MASVMEYDGAKWAFVGERSFSPGWADLFQGALAIHTSIPYNTFSDDTPQFSEILPLCMVHL